ncbi:MAG: methyltransferase family protein, partial [Candidatus Acidiferrales bacterium]
MNRTIRVVGKIALAGAAGAAIGTLLARRLPQLAQARLKLPYGIKISLALWVLFSIYWSIAAKDSAPTRSSESIGSRQLHLILVNIALLVLVFPVPGLTRQFLPASQFFLVAGLMVQAAFILLAVWARRNLGSNWSGEVRIAKEHQLVRSGPYRFIRHPIYTGVLGMYCGTALVS